MEAGANFVVADLRCAEIKRNDDARVFAIRTDVTKRDEITRLRDAALREFGTIDVLVNCAVSLGITR